MADSEWDHEEPEAFGYDGGQGDPRPAGPAAAGPARCPDCGGNGSVLLLITTRPCARCGGTGVVRPAPAGPVAEPAGYVLPADADPPPPGVELPPPICSYFVYENDVLASEDRLLFEEGQWWQERRVMADGELRLVSRAPASPPPQGWAKESAE
jgi:hypothetical protein